MPPVTVGIIGAGNVIWAYFQVLDRLLPRGLAQVGPVCARRQETWRDLKTRRPGIELVADPAEVLQSDVDVVLFVLERITAVARGPTDPVPGDAQPTAGHRREQ